MMTRADVKTTKRYDSVKELVIDSAKIHGDNPLFIYKVKKDLITKTYKDFLNDTMAFSNILKSLDLLGSHIAVSGLTSYEWVVTYLGTINSGSVIVPLDKELPADEIAELINRADVSAFVFDKVFKDRIDEIMAKCPKVKYFISTTIDEDSDKFLSFSKLLSNNQGYFDVEIDSTKMCTILFTSGTTGKPKGVMLSHESLADNATCMHMGLPAGTKMLSVLPIHHAYCFTCDILNCMAHGSVSFFNDSMMHLVKNANAFNPDVILLVPLIIESLYYRMREISNANPQVPKPMIAKKVLGTSIRIIFSGGAYLNPALITELAEYGIDVVQGYGMTEFSPRISANLPDFKKIDSVGVLIPGCEAKVEDGELLVRGKSRMLGYYKDEVETKKSITEDGWLRTGDLGHVDDDGFVYITGRKKNLIILSNGENVSPEELENKFNGWLVAKELIVRSEKGQIIAEMFPNDDFIQAAGISDVQKAFEAKIDEINTNLPLYKRIVKALIRDTEFPKTSSGKIKRH
ncbi:MAG: AMP-binding protein [Clostridia bacterium]|nr:AMP-binding protein [Clostridia bacterium]